jgi:CDP-diacylglycerol pyrophosphatase
VVEKIEKARAARQDARRDPPGITGTCFTLVQSGDTAAFKYRPRAAQVRCLERAADPDALWKIVHDNCVPCALVDLQEGDAKGYVVLKDLVGATQYLLIPTARVSGIESALLLAPEAPNYFADAWRERGYTERAAQHPLPRQAISLAINSAFGRSQNQLHTHRLHSRRCTSGVAAPACGHR